MRPDPLGGHTDGPAVRLGAVVVGGLAGVAAASVPALAVLLIGGGSVETPRAQILLLLIGFGGQFLAGFVAGSLAGRLQAVHGGLAAAAGFGALAAMALAAGSDPGWASLVFSVVVALVIGGAGGVIAAARRNRA
jgi:hypothetical protein